MNGSSLSAWVEVNLDQIRHNTEILRELIAPSEVCAVVKSDGYGHGAVEVATACLAGGATRLAVLWVEEAVHLRQAGITAPILIMSEPQAESMAEVINQGLTPTLYSPAGVNAFRQAVQQNHQAGYPVHVKVDTGMNRLGVRHTDAIALMRDVSHCDELYLEGVFTHFAVADQLDDDMTNTQGERFMSVLKQAADAGIAPPLVHAANSAAAVLYPELRFSFVRSGIALYGLSFSDQAPLPGGIEPALSVKCRILTVKRIEAGETVGYGANYRAGRATNIATCAMGYADGVPRNLYAEGGEALIGGKRYALAGTLSMGLLTIDCGNEDIRAGDEVVLIGQQGQERITADDWAKKTGTIGYEIVCRIGSNLPRRYDSH
jgi:alanine racemase